MFIYIYIYWNTVKGRQTASTHIIFILFKQNYWISSQVRQHLLELMLYCFIMCRIKIKFSYYHIILTKQTWRMIVPLQIQKKNTPLDWTRWRQRTRGGCAELYLFKDISRKLVSDYIECTHSCQPSLYTSLTYLVQLLYII